VTAAGWLRGDLSWMSGSAASTRTIPSHWRGVGASLRSNHPSRTPNTGVSIVQAVSLTSSARRTSANQSKFVAAVPITAMKARTARN